MPNKDESVRKAKVDHLCLLHFDSCNNYRNTKNSRSKTAVHGQSVSLLRSIVPDCFVKYENLPYLYFDRSYRKQSHTLEDIHQQIFLVQFHENLTLPRGVDKIFSMVLKLNHLPLVRLDFHKTLPGASAGKYLQVQREFLKDIYFHTKYMADFYVLQCKPEPRPKQTENRNSTTEQSS